MFFDIISDYLERKKERHKIVRTTLKWNRGFQSGLIITNPKQSHLSSVLKKRSCILILVQPPFISPLKKESVSTTLHYSEGPKTTKAITG